MKTLSVLLLALMGSLCNPRIATAQRIRLIEGNASILDGVTSINILFDYSQMRVGHFENDQDYIQHRKAELNEKNWGRGTRWAKAWIANRKSFYEPSFQQAFGESTGIEITSNPDVAYTLILKTTFTEPGYNIRFKRKSASIDAEAWIVFTTDTTQVLAKYSIEDAPGKSFDGYDFTATQRIAEAYNAAGTKLGQLLKSKSNPKQ
ncbi:MAG: hypothetical protein JST36_10970 [Bacteroidetes bacterium]|nr:hypothetical protein [Bacteroidota bacterium]